MKRISLLTSLFCILTLSFYSIASAKTTICEGPYALCAYAKCAPIPGEKGKVLCTCEAKSGYSIGNKNCQTKTLESRYYPVKQYVSCHNNRTWANCYNSKCIVNPDDKTQAFCTCSTVQNKGDYMLATDTCSTSGCESGIISSYVIKDAVSEFESLKKIDNYDKLPNYVPKVCSKN